MGGVGASGAGKEGDHNRCCLVARFISTRINQKDNTKPTAHGGIGHLIFIHPALSSIISLIINHQRPMLTESQQVASSHLRHSLLTASRVCAQELEQQLLKAIPTLELAIQVELQNDAFSPMLLKHFQGLALLNTIVAYRSRIPQNV